LLEVCLSWHNIRISYRSKGVMDISCYLVLKCPIILAQTKKCKFTESYSNFLVSYNILAAPREMVICCQPNNGSDQQVKAYDNCSGHKLIQWYSARN
jgi:hypothetical protein